MNPSTMRMTCALPLAIFLVGSSCARDTTTEEPTALEVAGSSSELRRDTDNDGHDDDDDAWYCGANYGKDKHNRNKCPAVAALTQPPAVKVGETTRLKGFAVDVDGPRKLKFSWTASPVTAGKIANPASKRTSFKCVLPGKVHLTLSASDGDCTRTAKVDVTCQPATQPACGDGAKNGNELCDNSAPNAADRCPTSCNDNVACTADTLVGSASSCNAMCTHAQVTCNSAADGCCPSGCTPVNDADCLPRCGDGVKSGSETCDSSDPNPANKCPTNCDDANACTTDALSGSGAACSAVCGHTSVTLCKSGDGCCPPGGVCTNANDNDCPPVLPVCGDGAKNGNETCDNSDPNPANKCPASCDDGDPCTLDSASGSAGTCNLACGHTVISVCTSGDGCCSATAKCRNPANGGTDNDCAVVPTCGDGVKSASEACDNSSPNAADKCPTMCHSSNACITVALVGSATDCTAMCTSTVVTACSLTVADNCCPSACNSNNDPDCLPVCGNGVVETSGNETCDPKSSCPTACNDGVACTKDVLVGDPSQCTAACTTQPITACVSGDGCCAPGCTHPNKGGTDRDCDASDVCHDGVKSGKETCDDTDPNPANRCPTSCNDNVSCTTDTQSGSPGTCDMACSHTPITVCTMGPIGDACCPPGCNANNDGDCIAVCGNGVLEVPELCDGATCPTLASCDDHNDCTSDSFEIDTKRSVSYPCNTYCAHMPITNRACLCGNGFKDLGESCDGADCDALIAACNDGNPCTTDTVTGGKTTCDVSCAHAASTTPECLCGNHVKDANETCDDSSPNAADKCPTAATCVTSDPCRPISFTGSASTCSASCTASVITQCKSGDMCCPNSMCNQSDVIGDSDCPVPKGLCDCEVSVAQPNCRDSLNRCYNFPEAKFAGGGALCKAELDCIHHTRCASTAPTDCLCGDLVDPFDCFTAPNFNAPDPTPGTFLNGVCKAEILAAAGSQLPADLNTRFFDPDFPSGAADTVIETCDAFYCYNECLAL